MLLEFREYPGTVTNTSLGLCFTDTPVAKRAHLLTELLIICPETKLDTRTVGVNSHCSYKHSHGKK